MPCSPLGTKSSGQARGLTPEAAGYLQVPPPVDRDGAACGMTVPGALVCFFPDVVDTKVIPPPRISQLSFPFSISDPVPVLVLAPAPFKLLRSFPSPLTPPFPSGVRSLVYAPVPISTPPPLPSPFPFSFFIISPPPPFLFPLCLRPHHRSRPYPCHLSLLPVARIWLPSRCNARTQTLGLAKGAVGCPPAPLLVCKDDDACGIKVPSVIQKRNDAEGVLLPFPPPDAGTR